MSTHSHPLTHPEDEQNIEKILDDLRRNAVTDVTPGEINPRAIAAQAVKQYWDDRAKGILDREGEPIDAEADAAMVARIASRRIVTPWHEFIVEVLFTLGPPLLIIAGIWFLPAVFKIDREVLYSKKLVISLITILIALSLLALSAAVRIYRRWHDGVKRTPISLQYSMGSIFGGLVSAAIIVMTLEYGFQQEKNSQMVRKDLQVVKKDLQAANTVVAKGQLIVFSRSEMEQLGTGGTENTSQQPENFVQLGNQKKLPIVKKGTHDRPVYEVNSEELDAPLQVQINKNSGQMSIVKDGRTETTKFYVGVVEKASEGSFTITFKNEQGVDTTKIFPLSDLLSKPERGQKVFVAYDPDKNLTVEVTVINEKDAGVQEGPSKKGE
jgi:uncharacterized membrane protein YhaH (DUF805 family)